MVFGIRRNYKKDLNILSLILFGFLLITNFDILIGYSVVKFLNVKVGSLPIERGFYLLGIALAIYYVLFMMLILTQIRWRLRSLGNALIMVEQMHGKMQMKRLKLFLKICSKVEDLLTSISKYFSCCNILCFANFFMIVFIFLFLGYDILAHELDSGDKIFFAAILIFSISNGALCFTIVIFSKDFLKFIKSNIQSFLKISLKRDQKKIRKICELGILQLGGSRKFISCGLFEINWKLIFLVFSSLFSHLITMIQFDYSLG